MPDRIQTYAVPIEAEPRREVRPTKPDAVDFTDPRAGIPGREMDPPRGRAVYKNGPRNLWMTSTIRESSELLPEPVPEVVLPEVDFLRYGPQRNGPETGRFGPAKAFSKLVHRFVRQVVQDLLQLRLEPEIEDPLWMTEHKPVMVVPRPLHPKDLPL
jgi:hypothetical protein